MLETLKKYLETNNIDHQIYFELTEEEIAKLKSLLKEDYGYIDIILDFSDLAKLDNLIANIPHNEYYDIYIKRLYEDYICYHILSQVSLEKEKCINSPEEIGMAIFSGNFEIYQNLSKTFFMVLERRLAKKAEAIGTKARIHFFLDNIKDKSLQEKINDLFYSRSSIIFMGYISKETLITNRTSNERILQPGHDYRSIRPDAYKRKRIK